MCVFKYESRYWHAIVTVAVDILPDYLSSDEYDAHEFIAHMCNKVDQDARFAASVLFLNDEQDWMYDY